MLYFVGAGHKACWVSEDYLRKEGRRPDVTVTYVTPSAKILGLQRYLPTLEKLCKDRDINVVPNTLLVEVCGEQQEAVFDCLGSDGLPTGEQKVCWQQQQQQAALWSCWSHVQRRGRVNL